MSDAATPLGQARYDGYVTIREDTPRDMIQLKCDLDDPALADALVRVTGAGLPARLGLSMSDTGSAAWMAPDELLLSVPRGHGAATLAALADALQGRHHLALDVSDMRAAIRLDGAAVREVLAKVTPVDMATLPVGTVRRTRVGQVAAALWLSGPDTGHVICFRSVGRYVFDLLSASARRGGEIGIF